MKEKTVIETKIGELKGSAWLFHDLPDDDYESVHDEESIQAAAKAWKMTPEAVKAIKEAFDFLVENLLDALEEDLQDIWKRI